MPPKPSIAECDRFMTAPGEVLEMEEVIQSGQKIRTWKNLPPTFREFFLSTMSIYSDRTFLSSPTSTPEGREHLAYGEVLNRALSLAAWMQSQDLGIGSRVGIGGANSTGWIVAFVATHLMGGIAVALNAWLPKDALIHCLTVSKPDIIFLDADRAAVLAGSAAALSDKGVGEMFCWSSTASLPSEIQRGVKDLEQFLSKKTLSVRDVRNGNGLYGLEPESDAVIFFTSGTSGPPKAALSNQRMALSNIYSGMVAPARAALRAGLPIPPVPQKSDPQRTLLLAIPLFHVTGCLSWLMRAFFAGAKLVLLHQWNINEAIRLIESENVKVIGGVPAVVSSILQSQGLKKDRIFDTVLYGGAPPSKVLAAEVKKRWPNAGLVQGYGMTETNAYACSIAGQDYVDRPDSTGPAVPVADLAIVHPESRKPLPTGQIGLLLIRGPQIMKCYYNNEEATRKAIDKDGWIDTGDIGLVDSEGFLFIKDRLKDIIIRGGENIVSADVENALYADSRISEAVAIGVPDERLGERVGVMVSLRSEAGNVNEHDLLDAVKPRLARHAWPAIIFINDGPLLRNANGKVVKKDLKPMLIEAWERQTLGMTNGKRSCLSKL